jgi:hypothetical protein
MRGVINMAHCENIPIPNKIIIRNFSLPTTLRGCVKATGRKNHHCAHADDETDLLKHWCRLVYGQFCVCDWVTGREN